MTDDELDRALFALPLEEPPADLHGRIMAATALRPAPTFATWEWLLLVVAVSLTTAATAWIFLSAPGSVHALGYAIEDGLRALGFYSRATYIWIAIGISSLWWISSLNFMPNPRTGVYNR
jgi:hypothetical protein